MVVKSTDMESKSTGVWGKSQSPEFDPDPHIAGLVWGGEQPVSDPQV